MKTVRVLFFAGFAALAPEGREAKSATSKKRLLRFFNMLENFNILNSGRPR